MIKKLFRWIFKDEVRQLQRRINQVNKSEEKFRALLDNVEIGVDVNHYSGSWAVISIQGKNDYIKFMDLGQKDIHEIGRFLRQFDKRNQVQFTIDANPRDSAFLKTQRF